jgi:hypothetical protein
MTPVARGVILAIVQVALMAAVGATLLYDRATLPRAWVETAGVDPNLPIRGRYVSLNLLFPAAQESAAVRAPDDAWVVGRLEVRDGEAVAVLRGRVDVEEPRPGDMFFRERPTPAGLRWMLMEPVAYFLPDHALDPTRDVRPGELWLEASFPERSAPRPIRLERRR